MILPLVEPDASVLRRVAEPVEELAGLKTVMIVNALWETLAHHGGLGLAAPQVGHAQRIAVVNVDGRRWTLVNPEMRPFGAPVTLEEGCLSLPGVLVPVERATAIRLRERPGSAWETVIGLPARVIQHEIDHLNGKLITDYVVAALAAPPEREQPK